MCHIISVFKYCTQEILRCRWLQWTLCYNVSAECVSYFIEKTPQSKSLQRFQWCSTSFTYFARKFHRFCSTIIYPNTTTKQWVNVTQELAPSAQEGHCWACWFGSFARYKNSVRQRRFRSSRHRRRCCVIARYWICSLTTQNNANKISSQTDVSLWRQKRMLDGLLECSSADGLNKHTLYISRIDTHFLQVFIL
jgi:hypothetical protein